MPDEKTYPQVTMKLGPLAPLVDSRVHGEPDNGSRSEAIRQMIARYDLICQRDQPKLSVAEWKLICDVMNGVWTSDGGPHLPLIWAEVSDGIRIDGLDKKWNVDGGALVERLRTLTQGQTIAVLDEVERFWRAVGRKEQPKVPGEVSNVDTGRG